MLNSIHYMPSVRASYIQTAAIPAVTPQPREQETLEGIRIHYVGILA